jgi:hypothetical protein
MFCWPCSSIFACNETNLMHYLHSAYWVTIILHVSGLPVAHHQDVAMYICDSWYVLYGLVDRRRTTRTNCCIHTLLPSDDDKLASPKPVKVYWLNKMNINRASTWFHYTQILLNLAFHIWQQIHKSNLCHKLNSVFCVSTPPNPFQHDEPRDVSRLAISVVFPL